jgi:alpha-tubulin suppressor-like RCC1 family protein
VDRRLTYFYGGLGDGTITARTLPVVVKNSAGTGILSGVTQTSAGEQHSCAVLLHGTARCWGGNSYGQLGDGTTTDSLLPVKVER